MPYGDRELIDLCGPEQLARIVQTLGKKWTHSVKRGSAIAVGRLADCKRIYLQHLQPERKGYDRLLNEVENKTFIKYNGMLYGHFYEDVTPIETFPWRGQLGWKTLTPDEKAKIKIL